MSFTIQFTSAPAGSGKTYGRGVRFAVEEFLPYQTGNFWSNYPLNVDAMVAHVCECHPKLDADEIRSRIRIIPTEVLKEWRTEKSTPADYFGQFTKDELWGSHIAIDEIHKFCNRHSHKDVVKKWQEWLGELRHDGVTFECLTQAEMKVLKSIRDEALLQRFMFNTENKPDPFFGILMGDWYELRAGFITGTYRSKVVESVQQECMGKMVPVPEMGRVYSLDPALFTLYDSYSGRDDAAAKDQRGRKHVFQSESKLGLIRWFLRRNFFRFSSRVAVLAFGFWICFLGGAVTLLNTFTSYLNLTKPAAVEVSPAPHHDVPQFTAATSATTSSGAIPSSFFNDAKTGKPSSADPVRDYVTKLQADLAARDKEIEKLKSDGARFAEIVALFGEQVTLRCGVTVDVGEQIPLGPLKGRAIKGISHAKRRVILDDGTVLPLSP